VYTKNIFLFILTMTLCAGCGGNIGNAFTATPEFVTATLPPAPSPQAAQATQMLTLTAPVSSAVEESNTAPVEGTTTTQVNVRAGTSTASKSLGMIGPFVKVQVIGRDASGSWHQIVYAESETGKGWVRAEYVQVNAPAEIPLVDNTTGSGSSVSGLVIQKINVRNGPGTEHDLLGVLNSNDIVFITGKDPGGAWIQIEFAGAPDPDGKGWVAAEFLQVGNIEAVPIIGAAVEETAMPTGVTSTPNVDVMSAMQDGDSMQTPLAVAVFSATDSSALQVSGDVSAPDGDTEDWIRFTTTGEVVAIEVTCPGNTLRVELWQDEKPVDGFSLSCGDKSFVAIAPNNRYFLRLSNVNESEYANYILSVEGIR
jgi:uncharacterized protein YraI